MQDKIINKLENKIPWGIIGVVLTIIFGIIGVYTYLNQIKPNMQYQIINESNVFDIHKPLKDLTILLKNEDIQKQDLNLKIYTIKISNVGYIDILQNHFDENIIWGLKIKDGKIINKIRFINSNSKYITNELKIINSDNIVEFSKIIFEKDKFFSIEILVLHNKNIIPNITPMGKIVGIEQIQFIKDIKIDTKETIIQRLFNDNILINIFRFVINFIIFIVFILILGITLDFFENKKKEKEKEKKKELIEDILKTKIDDKYEMALYIEIYEKNIKELEYIYKVFSRQSKLLTNEIAVLKKEDICSDEIKKLEKQSKLSSDIKYLIKDLIDKNILTYIDDDIEIKEQFRDYLEKIIDYKKTNG